MNKRKKNDAQSKNGVTKRERRPPLLTRLDDLSILFTAPAFIRPRWFESETQLVLFPDRRIQPASHPSPRSDSYCPRCFYLPAPPFFFLHSVSFWTASSKKGLCHNGPRALVKESYEINERKVNVFEIQYDPYRSFSRSIEMRIVSNGHGVPNHFCRIAQQYCRTPQLLEIKHKANSTEPMSDRFFLRPWFRKQQGFLEG